MKHLEECLQKAILSGQPGSGEPWRKIVIVVEGIYSMEGSIANLPQILKLKRKYKVAKANFLLFVLLKVDFFYSNDVFYISRPTFT